MAQMDDFIKPESMLTPGIAGSTAMMITNTLYFNFGLSQQMTCLALSFVLGSLVFVAENTSMIKKSVYYVLNSLIIFSIAAGTNTFGVKFTGDAKTPSDTESAAFTIIASAWADNHAGGDNNATTSDTDTENNTLTNMNTSTSGNASSARTDEAETVSQPVNKSATDKSTRRRFFSTW